MISSRVPGLNPDLWNATCCSSFVCFVCVFFVIVLCLVCPMFSVSLDCPLVIIVLLRDIFHIGLVISLRPAVLA
jgi:hypothetical protein